MTIAEWYRTKMLKADGRVVLWEHFYTYLPVFLAIGFFLTHRYQSIWPFVVSVSIGSSLSLWSYRQDMILHNSDITPRKIEAVVPLSSIIGAIITLVLTVAIITEWFVLKHY